MPKASRTFVWSVVAGITGIAVLWLTQPDTPTSAHHVKVGHTASTSDSDGISADDLAAHFPRYHGGDRDPFAPGIAPGTSAAGDTGMLFADASGEASQSGWALTGIDTVNSITSALVENSRTGDSVDLHTGDTWQGLKVTSIEPDAVVFTNLLGQQTRLPFVTVVPDTVSQTANSAAANPASTPSDSSITPLPPMPVGTQLNTNVYGGGGRRRGRRQNFQPADTTESPVQ